MLQSLMDRSMYDSPQQSRTVLHRALLAALVPDEARIFAALSQGAVYPVIHVARPGVGAQPQWVLRNASTVGRAAGVCLPQFTPEYLTRMSSLGLVGIGPHTEGMADEYEMLLTDAAVHAAVSAERRGLRAARIVRASVSLTELGRELWEAVT
jgi:hypothetical protein